MKPMESKSEKIASIDDVLADSAKKIGAEPQAAPIKRGRGRPRKTPLPGDAGAHLEASPQAAQVAPVAAPVDLETPHPELKGLLQVPCRIVAEMRDFEGYNMPDDVALALTGPLHAVFEKYLPQTGGEHSAAISLGLGIGSFFLAAYLSERDHKRAQAKKAAEDAAKVDQAGQVERPFPVISAT